ncbi:flagellar biosynthetic protein FliR [Sphingomonas sp. KRR8]|uniref:flagellar biosynthetic protein FliR n=1 Tax=Sphingomonas sp. KRR8 TaxID=2942996 RepID=UPI00201FC751|nr:flagellar biosynthetic protein FliR [Sphingomonas sp. KRR8]URD61908.1 flagellar biosynthetic protein FliR [Sphingomonas sp. KRR8]
MADMPMEATAFLILFARVGAVLMLLPILSEEAAPGQVRLVLSLAISLALFGLLRSAVMPSAGASDGALLAILVAELLTGLAIGSVIRLMFQAAAMAGALVSLQIGLTTVLTFDAQAGQVPLLAKFMALAAALVCFATGVHHQWIVALVRSYSLFPVGGQLAGGDWMKLAITTATQALSLAVSLSAPFILYAIVFNFALGLGARLAPTLQLFFVAQPLDLLLGFAIFALAVGGMLTLFAERFAGWLQASPLGG